MVLWIVINSKGTKKEIESYLPIAEKKSSQSFSRFKICRQKGTRFEQRSILNLTLNLQLRSHCEKAHNAKDFPVIRIKVFSDLLHCIYFEIFLTMWKLYVRKLKWRMESNFFFSVVYFFLGYSSEIEGEKIRYCGEADSEEGQNCNLEMIPPK